MKEKKCCSGCEERYDLTDPKSGRGRRNVLESEIYRSESADENLMALIRELGHINHYFFNEGKGGQGRVLHILTERGTITQRELTILLGIKPGSASEIIGKLETAGLVLRSQNAEDKRTSDVSITNKGIEMSRALNGIKEEKTRELFAVLTEEEKDLLHSVLEKLYIDWKDKTKSE